VTELDLAEIEKYALEAAARADKATDSPWAADAHYWINDPNKVVVTPIRSRDDLICEVRYPIHDSHTANIVFISNARDDVPQLAKHCLALVAEVERLTFELDATHKFANGLREEIDVLHEADETMTEAHNNDIQTQREMISALRKKLHELGVSA